METEEIIVTAVDEDGVPLVEYRRMVIDIEEAINQSGNLVFDEEGTTAEQAATCVRALDIIADKLGRSVGKRTPVSVAVEAGTLIAIANRHQELLATRDKIRCMSNDLKHRDAQVADLAHDLGADLAAFARQAAHIGEAGTHAQKERLVDALASSLGRRAQALRELGATPSISAIQRALRPSWDPVGEGRRVRALEEDVKELRAQLDAQKTLALVNEDGDIPF